MYCFRGTDCDETLEKHERATPVCSHGVDMRRDWKAEGVGIGTGVRVSRTGTDREMAQLFLPDNNEFAGPGDPDGKKGAREWLDTHQPKEPGGHNPLLEIERRSF
jgi:hypothetical protein